MFVKKDLRKIPEILSSDDKSKDKTEPLIELKLARRQGEFQGNLNVLCSNPTYIPKFKHLTTVSLYDCGLHDLRGIGVLGEHSNVRKLNLGRNDFTELPPDFALLADTLEELWLDDCKLEGKLPESIYQLVNLKILRLPGNRIHTLNSDSEDGDEDGISALNQLEVLCLDNNALQSVPNGIVLPKLQSFLIRQNEIEDMSEMCFSGMPSLRVLHLSSNRLRQLPGSISACQELEELYVNGNKLTELPCRIDYLEKLKVFNASDNKINALHGGFVDRFGRPDKKTGKCSMDDRVNVMLAGNPILKSGADYLEE